MAVAAPFCRLRVALNPAEEVTVAQTWPWVVQDPTELVMQTRPRVAHDPARQVEATQTGPWVAQNPTEKLARKRAVRSLLAGVVLCAPR